MMRLVYLLLALCIVGLAVFFLLPRGGPEICTTDEALTAPSGRVLTLCDVVYEIQPNNDAWVVVRVTDPALPEGRDVAEVSDHDWACEIWGLEALEKEPRPTRIIVQVMQTPFVRGEPAPGIRQAIEAYTEDNGTCIWELL
ncbi:DUF6497 family protein [Hasllibacter sp. MH4015]|uniref:DUF6497 family protein n=1 Tax=Hasllibacter sp. MH4015 TaxID=2854029 RepID=UPI001CD32522|nr:DUF6497 family protein [Hasllibacter sp. MH4015]